MKLYLSIPVALIAAGPAAAHPGHLAEVAGHGHWLGLAALGAAIAIAAAAVLKSRSDKAKSKDAADEAEEDADDAVQEA